MVQGFQTNYLNDMTCLNRQTNGQTNSQTSRQTKVKPVVKRAVKPTVKLTVKPTVKPVCLQATHTAQCHNQLLNNDGFKIPPAKLNVQCSPRTECTINATKKKRPKKVTRDRYVCQSNQRKKKRPSARISHLPFQKGNCWSLTASSTKRGLSEPVALAPAFV
jgi:hypothetical protein